MIKVNSNLSDSIYYTFFSTIWKTFHFSEFKIKKIVAINNIWMHIITMGSGGRCIVEKADDVGGWCEAGMPITEFAYE